MFIWRNALILGLIFIGVGLVYWWVQGNGATMDRAGVVELIILGAAMMFTFTILLRGSRGL